LNLSSKFGLLLSFQSQLAAASSPINEVLKVFQEEGKFFVTGGRREFHGLQQGITFRNLTFAYATDRDVLHDVSLVIRAKRTTAIVGPTGAGKSTLIHLLMRYYDCPSRSIFLDEVDIREFQLDSYLARIALVSQDTLLFHDTLRNNITYGLTDVPEEILQNVVARARLGGLIEQLPLGLDTPIGDRGVQLSGGEKQRVSIARALLKNAEILILDEATSALDSQTENLIQEAINDAMQNRTGIVIAHRLSTIKHADEIVVLKDGCLAEQGTLQDLLQLQGVFARLWKEQSF
jgi:subfamily B ATP-binding cassette protein MsbA